MKERASSSSRKSRAPRPREMSRSARSTIRAIASGRERLEDDDLAAGQERAVELEGGVLGRRADEHDVAGLDEGQEDVLLGAVEAVDLVEKEDRPLVRPEAPGLLEDFAHLLHAGGHRRVGDEVRRGLRGDQPRERRLADAGRAPQDQRRDPVLGDRSPQKAVGSDDLGRPLDLVERARPHAVGERRARPRSLPSRRVRRPAEGRRRGPVTESTRGRLRHGAASSDRRQRLGADRDGLAVPPRRQREPAVDPGSADGVAHHVALAHGDG